MGPTAVVAAVATALLGTAGLLGPRRVAAEVGIRPEGTLGVSEVRATYGGLFLAAGIAALVLGSSDAAWLLGVAWGGAALARLASTAADGTRGRRNTLGVLVEAGLCALFVLGT
jgi:hypothetical protein